MKNIFNVLILMLLSSGSYAQSKMVKKNPYYSRTDTKKLNVKNSEWKTILSAELFAVARQGATEKAFTGKYWDSEAIGTYYCSVCGNALFKSDAKFCSSF